MILYFLVSYGSRCEVPHTVNKTKLRKFVVGEEEISELLKEQEKSIENLIHMSHTFKERRI